MKRKLLLMTTLAAAIAAGTIPADTAFAAVSDLPEYPASFIQHLDMSADGLTDYAIDGDSYAFAVKTTLYVLYTDEGGDRKLSEFHYGSEITKIDYADGKLYYCGNSNNAYVYPDKETPVRHEFPALTSPRLEIGEHLYLLDNQTGLTFFNNVELFSMGEGFSGLKKFGGKAYVVKDNVPYVLSDGTMTALDLQYTDFSAADDISTGNLATKLKAADYAVKRVELKDKSYYTQIKTDVIADKFTQVRTYKATGDVSGIVLAEEGGVSVIAVGENCFVTATQNLTVKAYTPPLNDWAQGPNGQRKAYLRERTGVYSSPYMCKATLITTANAEKAIAVTVQEKFALDFMDTTFYRISYTDAEGAVISGFVASGYLDGYDYSADVMPPAESDTGKFSYDTNVTTVILILVIVGLVIIAIVYLTAIGTKQDKRTKRKKKKRSDEEEY